jgi:hypothetical protein
MTKDFNLTSSKLSFLFIITNTKPIQNSSQNMDYTTINIRKGVKLLTLYHFLRNLISPPKLILEGHASKSQVSITKPIQVSFSPYFYDQCLIAKDGLLEFQRRKLDLTYT